MSRINQPVKIYEYNPVWPKIFQDLKETIMNQIGDLGCKIEHVGSTSIPGLASKEIIDMDIIIESMDIFPIIKEKLALLGYEHNGDQGILGREAFGRLDEYVPYNLQGNTKRKWMNHHLYVCTQDSIELHRHLKFRDYLRTHPKSTQQYSELKKALASKYGYDREGYTNAKTEFIENILKKSKDL